ncbi:hypothetical protein BU23DRAFT_601387 [Bimuria novae-zelandiae CBS 107.79]|uniref:F-box domain-containing protein n=1 Tax=Bimuria novae-zelandiae CBS 107.79 TaxID=1447943 RepID=A0A6A5UYH2_9PLEO|nr:hypothetical protein BU23DRAFT_601387 [Bimuria novae-zelandiae CBS 107.79]
MPNKRTHKSLANDDAHEERPNKRLRAFDTTDDQGAILSAESISHTPTTPPRTDSVSSSQASKRKHDTLANEDSHRDIPNKRLHALDSTPIPAPSTPPRTDSASPVTFNQPSPREQDTDMSHTPNSTPEPSRTSFLDLAPELRVKIYAYAYYPSTDAIASLSGLCLSCRTTYAEVSGPEGELVKIAADYYASRAMKRQSKKLTFPVRIARPQNLSDLHRPTLLVHRCVLRLRWKEPVKFSKHLKKAVNTLQTWPVRALEVDFYGDAVEEKYRAKNLKKNALWAGFLKLQWALARGRGFDELSLLDVNDAKVLVRRLYADASTATTTATHHTPTLG